MQYCLQFKFKWTYTYNFWMSGNYDYAKLTDIIGAHFCKSSQFTSFQLGSISFMLHYKQVT